MAQLARRWPLQTLNPLRYGTFIRSFLSNWFDNMGMKELDFRNSCSSPKELTFGRCQWHDCMLNCSCFSGWWVRWKQPWQAAWLNEPHISQHSPCVTHWDWCCFVQRHFNSSSKSHPLEQISTFLSYSSQQHMYSSDQLHPRCQSQTISSLDLFPISAQYYLSLKGNLFFFLNCLLVCVAHLELPVFVLFDGVNFSTFTWLPWLLQRFPLSLSSHFVTFGMFYRGCL